MKTLDATRSGASDLLRAAAIFLVVLSISFLGYSRTLPPTADEMIDFSLAQSIAKWGVVSIDQVSTVGPNPEEFGAGGHRYSKYGPLQAILSVPLFTLAEHLPIGEVDTVLLLNHLLSGLTTALVFLLVRRLGYRPEVALALAILVFFGTPLWVHSKRFFGEPTITLTIVATLLTTYLAATTARARWLILAGVCFGLAVAAKYIDALLLAPIPLYLAWSSYRPESPPAESESARSRLVRLVRSLALFAVGAVPIVIALAVYNDLRFGSPLDTGYAHWEGFSTPVWVGVAGFLFSPGKSIFLYTPALLLLPFWAAGFLRRFPKFGVLLLVLVVDHLLVYGAWWVWWGAWAWGPRFIVPILPCLVLLLAEGLANVRGAVLRAGVAALWLLSVGIQVLGISVDHTVYMVQLLPLNPKPDTLTLYDLRYQPIIHQIPLMTRQWLDFAWMERTGPSLVDPVALGAALLGVLASLIALTVGWLSPSRVARFGTLALAGVVICGAIYVDLRHYVRQDDPAVAKLAARVDRAPADATVLQLIPSVVVPFANEEKGPMPELGWIEEPKPQPRILSRLTEAAATSPEIWVATQTGEKSPANGIESWLDRRFVEVSNQPIGRFRILRYVTNPATVPFVRHDWKFGDGLELTGFAVHGSARPGGLLDVILEWRADANPPRQNYTVFVHLVTASGTLVAQHDDPPAQGYAPTGNWPNGQVLYDDHTISIPANAPDNLHLVQVGLYLPSTGKRLALLPGGDVGGDTVTIDLRKATPVEDR